MTAAGPLEDGLAAYDRGDFATAMRLWRPLAEQGNVTAQYNLGVMYAKGRGVPQDYVQAYLWFNLAASRLSDVKHRDDAEAVKWYRLAAEQGYASAQYNLGLMYAKGQGVPQDYVQAHMWFDLAASRFPARKAKRRDQAIGNRAFVASKMTPAQLAEAQRLAREWKPKKGKPK